MKINLKRLKLHPRESETFYLQGRGRDSFLEGLGGKYLAPIELEMVVENTGTVFVGRGTVNTRLQLTCSRCLQEFIYPLMAEIDALMVESIHNDIYSADEGFILFSDDAVDILPRVEEVIFMAIGICPLCREDCPGICPICGQDKNVASCSCNEDTVDPRWAKLKNL